MDFTNPDNRAKVFVGVTAMVLFLFIVAIWIDSGKLAGTAAALLITVVGAGVWTIIGYEEESYEEAAERKRRRRGLDKAA